MSVHESSRLITSTHEKDGGLPMLDQVSTCWFTRLEAAAYARVSLATLDRWARDGKIVRHKTPGGRAVRYTKTDLDNAMVREGIAQ